MTNRRNFLRIAGVGLTGSMINPLRAQSAKLNTIGQKIKVGVLLPQSIENPVYPQSFLNGLKLGMDQHKAFKKGKIELITEQTNFSTPLIVKEKSQKLITENNVDVITGIVNSEVVSHVAGIFKNAQVPGIFANAGESYLVNELKQNPYLFFNSLNLFQAAYETGKYAVNNFGKNVAIITSFYDSGYDSLFTFREGVQKAGGNTQETYVANGNDDNFITDTIAKLKESKPDCVYVFMHGNESDEMIRSLYFQKLSVPILTTGFSTEKHRLNNLGEAGNKIISLASWNNNLESDENAKFVDRYLTEFRKEPDSFAVLGFETGMIIYSSLVKSNGNYSGLELAESIKNTSLRSPRGDIYINKKSGFVSNKLLISQTRNMSLAIPENQVLKSITPVDEFEESFAVLDNEFRSGWLNPYLFV